MKKLFINFLIVSMAFLLTRCSGDSEIGTGVSNPPTSTTSKAALAVSALFSSSEESANVNPALKSESLKLRATDESSLLCDDGINCTCELLEDVEMNSLITVSYFGDSGEYGSVTEFVTVGETDFCRLSDGTDNSGFGPDGNGLFAAFEVIAAVEGSCVDGEETTDFTMAPGSFGIYRDLSETNTWDDSYINVYGTFTIDVDGTETEVNCAMNVDNQAEEVILADCSDENGNAITQDIESDCEFETQM